MSVKKMTPGAEARRLIFEEARSAYQTLAEPSVRGIMGRIGIATAVFYRQFKSLSDLKRLVAVDAMEKLRDALKISGDPAREYVIWARANPLLFRLIFSAGAASVGSDGHRYLQGLLGDDIWAAAHGIAELAISVALDDATVKELIGLGTTE